jgi:hypothetical protein
MTSLPFPRSSHRIVYDVSRRSLVMFGGGFSRAVRAEGVLWEWRDERWRAVGGQLDAGRNEPGMCYDRRRKRIVIFGGWDETSTFRGDTWEWTGEDLVRVDSIGPGIRPAPRAGHAFVYDPSRERCLLYGGRGADGWLADTWAWNGSGWRRLDVEGPSARWFFGAAADPVNDRIVIFGGAGADGDHGDTWAWDGDRWTRIATTGPPARSMAKLAFDGADGILLFGGRRRTDTGLADLADTWILRDGEWRRP